jgi:ketosteroid isomerase-like protein
VSQENVDFVVGLYQAPEVDYVRLYRDDDLWAELAEALAPFIHMDFERVQHAFGGERRFTGLDGLRAFMLDWTAPWVTYGIETEKVIDLGDRVLVLNRDRGRREAYGPEIWGRVGALWTLRGGQVARLDAFTTQAEALKAVGLEE